jgi:hypothetical protein
VSGENVAVMRSIDGVVETFVPEIEMRPRVTDYPHWTRGAPGHRRAHIRRQIDLPHAATMPTSMAPIITPIITHIPIPISIMRLSRAQGPL